MQSGCVSSPRPLRARLFYGTMVSLFATPELIRVVTHAMGRPARLWPVPVGMLELAGALIGKRAAVARLTGSLWVDSSLIRRRLGWAPPFTLEQGLAATVWAEHAWCIALWRLLSLNMEKSRD